MSIETGLDQKSIGPGRAIPGFLNADQRFNRDLTVSFLNTFKPHLYLDGFSATGIRGLRAEKEAGIRAVMVERNRKAFEILRRNLESNSSTSEAYNDTFESIVSKFKFDFIDVDPYGDVVPYVDVSLNYVKNRGYIGFTATDLSVLTGSLKENTARRYGSVVANNSMRHEMGIRNLIGFIARHAVSMERGIRVMLSAYHGHFYRIILQILKGSGEAKKTAEKIGYFNPSKEISELYDHIDYGPIWIGPLEEAFTVCTLAIPETVSEEYGMHLNGLIYEDTGIFFDDVGEIFSMAKMNLPSIRKVLDFGNEKGLEIHRTHFSNTGVKIKNKKEFATDILNEFRS